MIDQIDWDLNAWPKHPRLGSRPFDSSTWTSEDRPCVVLDQKGRILVWHLPGVLGKDRVVRMIRRTRAMGSVGLRCVSFR